MGERRRWEDCGFLFWSFGRYYWDVVLFQVSLLLSRIWVELHYKAPNYYELSFNASYLSPERPTAPPCIKPLLTLFLHLFSLFYHIFSLFFFSTVFHIKMTLQSNDPTESPIELLSFKVAFYVFYHNFRIASSCVLNFL